MLQRFVPFLGTAALTLTATLIVAEPAAAQYRGGREGSSYGNSPWPGGLGGYYYGPAFTSGGYKSLFSPYYGSRYSPGIFGYDSTNYPYGRSSDYREDGSQSMYPPEDARVVHISVRVSPNAEIWFDGEKTTQSGSRREFVTPAIASDGECNYAIRARWTEGGREVDQTRNVSFHAGDRLTVKFTTPQAKSTAVIGQDADKAVPPVAREEEPRQARDQVANDADKSTHDGKVVSIADDNLVMSGKGDSEHSHALTADVKFTCDGKVCKREDIKAGMKIRVTTKKDDKHTVSLLKARTSSIFPSPDPPPPAR